MRRPPSALLPVVDVLVLSSPTLQAKEKSEYWAGAFSEYVEIPGAVRVGSETCVSCHAEVNNSFKHSYHSQQRVEREDYHSAGSLHVNGNGVEGVFRQL